MKKLLIVTSLIAGIGFVSSAFSDPVASVKGKITGYYTGWTADALRITIENATYSEIAGCAIQDGYMTDDTVVGYNTNTAVLLSAFLSGKSVRVLVMDCLYNRPKIVGVEID